MKRRVKPAFQAKGKHFKQSEMGRKEKKMEELEIKKDDKYDENHKKRNHREM